MTGKRITYYILTAFIAGNLLLIYIQYNSAKNINTLITGNEKVLNEIDVTNSLRELNREIVSIDAKTATAANANAALKQDNNIDAKVIKIQTYIDTLQKISDDDSSVKYIDVLDQLVHKKLTLSKNALAHPELVTFISNTPNGILLPKGVKELNDSIRQTTRVIENSREKLLTQITAAVDKSGRKALGLSNTLIILVLTSGAILFWIIISTIKKQSQLINQLNLSEKKVRETAAIKENFMANMSHEIRTPMNAVLGFTNLLQKKNLDAESKQYVQTIQKSGENLLDIINDILDLSKIEAGMMRIENAPFNIRGLLHSVETMFKAKVVEKQLAFSVSVDDLLPEFLEGDATRLTQILVNLISNALKFTNKGGISITITIQAIIGDTINTCIKVSDTGIGIKAEKISHIFERFHQGEDSVTRRYGGTGLGLSIVNELVILQQGNINVQTNIGQGASFIVTLPYKKIVEPIANPQAINNSTTSQFNFNSVCILVVEDNEINQTLIKHLFKNWQLQFDMVSNGKEAVNILQQKKYNLILMDIQMPEMDGYTAAQEIRNTLKINTPIIAMTAHAMAGEREKCLNFGMNEYISKPIHEKKLHELINSFINENKASMLQQAVSNSFNNHYRYINLQYMKEVSNGNIAYEKKVTEQFIELLPHDLQQMENAFKINDIAQVRKVAHNLKTTVSVMGLNEKLQPCLDTLEYDNHNENNFGENINSLKSICNTALTEARQFYKSLS